jgi:threonine 3-dehydrogenase
LAQANNVIGTDVKQAPAQFKYNFESLDVTDKDMVKEIFRKYKPTHVIHLSAVLSGAGEKNPDLAMKVNLDGFMNVLELAKEHKCQIFSPSTIAAFGPDTPLSRTPDATIMRPTTIYGITKVYMELMGEYYHSKYGVDFRSVRLPGVISPEPIHGMGTTDYAVEIFLSAAQRKPYACYLNKDTRLPMMYIDDTLSAILKLIKAPSHDLHRRVYNVSGLDFSPDELAKAIQEHVNFDFKVTYKPDFRQDIADSWPNSLKDTCARKDWKWIPRVNSLKKLTMKMFKEIRF